MRKCSVDGIHACDDLHEVGESMALVNTAGAIGGFLGTWFGGLLSGIGPTPSPSPMFFFCAMCLIVAAGLGLSARQKSGG